MADCGDDPSPLEVLVCIRVHHQQPGLISPFLYEGDHLCMPHALDVHTIHLETTGTKRGGFQGGRKVDFFGWLCNFTVTTLGILSANYTLI